MFKRIMNDVHTMAKALGLKGDFSPDVGSG
jgi:hypothetical protein